MTDGQGRMCIGHRHSVRVWAGAIIFALLAGAFSGEAPGAAPADEEVALSLANMLRAARAVIAENQDLINDPDVGDKGLTGEAVLTAAIAKYKASTGEDPQALDPKSERGHLLAAQMAAVREVTDEHQDLINHEGMGFKGFVPAVFARLVNERFAEKAGERAIVKVTAPAELVRNRTARPDAWEATQIEGKLKAPDWPRGQTIAEATKTDGRSAYRVLVPEYYSEGCLSCHGEPAGELDVTGYPKEGGQLGDLGGAISITLFR